MNWSTVVSVLIAGVIGAVPVNSPAGEKASPTASSAGERQIANGWHGAVETTWLPAAPSRDGGGDVSMTEGDVRLTRSISLSPRLSIAPEAVYSYRLVDAPSSARLPAALHYLSVGVRGDFIQDRHLSWSAVVAPGVAGDFRGIGTADLRSRIGFWGRYSISERTAVTAGLLYLQGNRSLPVLPVIGVSYRPDDRWAFTLGAPRSGISFVPSPGTRLFAGAEMSGGEYRLHDSGLGAKVVRYRDFRGAGGLETGIFQNVKLQLTGGYAFARKFVFYETTEPARDDVDVAGGPFLRGGIRVDW